MIIFGVSFAFGNGHPFPHLDDQAVQFIWHGDLHLLGGNDATRESTDILSNLYWLDENVSIVKNVLKGFIDKNHSTMYL